MLKPCNLQKTFLKNLFLLHFLGKKKKKKIYNSQKPKEMTWKTRQEKSKVLGGKERMMERSGLSAQSLFDKWMILQVLWNMCGAHLLCPTFWNPMDCSLPDSSIHGIFQTWIQGWVATSSPRVSSRLRDWPRDQTCISCISCIGRYLSLHYSET